MVLLFGSYTWVLSAEKDRMVDGTHNGFLIQITGKWARQKADGMWVTPRAEVVQ